MLCSTFFTPEIGEAAPPPAAPTNLTASNSGLFNAIALSWTASAGASSYNIYVGSNPGAESPTPLATGITGTTYTDSNLSVQAFRYYTVTASNGSESSPSNEASATFVPQLLLSNWTGSPGTNITAYTPDKGSTWTVVQGTWQIQSSGTLVTTSNNDGDFIVADCGSADYTFLQTLTASYSNSGNVAAPGIVFRDLNTSNLLILDFGGNGVAMTGQGIRLISIVAGSGAVLQTAGTIVSGTSYNIKLVATGANFTLYVNGSIIMTFANVLQTAATKIGLRLSKAGSPPGNASWGPLEVDGLALLSRWVKNNASGPSELNPVVITAESPDQFALEPNVWWSVPRSTWLCQHSQGVDPGPVSRIVLRTSPGTLLSGPTNVWSSPTDIIGGIGHAAGETSTNCAFSSVYVEAGTTYSFYGAVHTGQLELCVATSTDDITWTRIATNIIPINSSNLFACYSTRLLKVGSTYQMLLEHAPTLAQNTFIIGLWQSSAITSGYSLVVTPLLGNFSAGGNGNFGGPRAAVYDATADLWHMWQHTDPPEDSTEAQSYMNHATVPSVLSGTWTSRGQQMYLSENPINGSVQTSQNANSDTLLQIGSNTWMYYDIDGTSAGAIQSSICLAIYLGPISQLFLETAF